MILYTFWDEGGIFANDFLLVDKTLDILMIHPVIVSFTVLRTICLIFSKLEIIVARKYLYFPKRAKKFNVPKIDIKTFNLGIQYIGIFLLLIMSI